MFRLLLYATLAGIGRTAYSKPTSNPHAVSLGVLGGRRSTRHPRAQASRRRFLVNEGICGCMWGPIEPGPRWALCQMVLLHGRTVAPVQHPGSRH